MGYGCGGYRVSWASLARRVSRVGHRPDSVVKTPNNRRHSAVTRSYLSCIELWCMWGTRKKGDEGVVYLRVSERMGVRVCRLSYVVRVV